MFAVHPVKPVTRAPLGVPDQGARCIEGVFSRGPVLRSRRALRDNEFQADVIMRL